MPRLEPGLDAGSQRHLARPGSDRRVHRLDRRSSRQRHPHRDLEHGRVGGARPRELARVSSGARCASRMPGEPGRVGSRVSPLCPDAGTSSRSGTGGPAATPGWPTSSWSRVRRPRWKIQGQVFPGDPPPPYAEGGTTITRPEASGPVADDAVAVVTGTASCPGLDFACTTDPDGTWHVRDDYHADRCTLTTDDPRVTRGPLLHLEHATCGGT